MRGASTITQQVIKNVTENDDVTIQRKAQEILKALNLEKKYDKTEILEMYLNSIYLSQGCYGVGAAAYTYFGKEVKDLTLIESAALACITQYPYYYDPIINPQHNAEKRNLVLKYMYDQGKITQEEFLSAYEKEFPEMTTRTPRLRFIRGIPMPLSRKLSDCCATNSDILHG